MDICTNTEELIFIWDTIFDNHRFFKAFETTFEKYVEIRKRYEVLDIMAENYIEQEKQLPYEFILTDKGEMILMICGIVVLAILIGVIFAVIGTIVSLRRQRKILRVIEEIKEVSQNQERQKRAEESGQGNQADNDT